METARRSTGGASHKGILALVGLLSVLVLVADSNLMKVFIPAVADGFLDTVQPALTMENNSSFIPIRITSPNFLPEEAVIANVTTKLHVPHVEQPPMETKHNPVNNKRDKLHQPKVQLPALESASLRGTSNASEMPVSVEKHQQTQLPESLKHPFVSMKMQENATHEAFPDIADNNIFSACMLTMDDNHFLIEWLSYHYHTLPLRDFIVAVDPNGRTSPSKIFDRWRSHGMRIEQWTDKNFMPPPVYARSLWANLTEQDKVDLHRERQNYFQANCIRHLKRRGRTWTLMIDSDEYLRLNQRKAAQDKISIPSMSEEGAILKFLQQQEPKAPPCIMVPRLRVGTVESSPKVNRTVPEWVNRTAFQTLRFRRHFARNNVGMHKTTKNILDVSRIQNKDIWVTNPHRTIQAICPQEELFKLVDDSIYVVHHYLGTWEQFSSRNDARQGPGRSHHPGTYDMYKVADAPDSDDDSIQPWLEGFVNSTGSTRARNLLRGVGVVGYDEGR